jgi:hypothetical protein
MSNAPTMPVSVTFSKAWQPEIGRDDRSAFGLAVREDRFVRSTSKADVANIGGVDAIGANVRRKRTRQVLVDQDSVHRPSLWT